MMDIISIQKAHRILSKLLKTGELKENEYKELYLQYINEANVRNILDLAAKEWNVTIMVRNSTIYLIPGRDNDILGFNINNCKDKHLLGETLEERYLSYLIMTIIFSEFTNEISPSEYIEIIEIINLVDESFERAINKEDINELEVKKAFNITSSYNLWKSKDKWDDNDDKKHKAVSAKYQIGVVRRIIRFLKNERLINVIDIEDKIVPTQRFIDLMEGYFLNEDRKAEIEKLLMEEPPNAEN